MNTHQTNKKICAWSSSLSLLSDRFDFFDFRWLGVHPWTSFDFVERGLPGETLRKKERSRCQHNKFGISSKVINFNLSGVHEFSCSSNCIKTLFIVKFQIKYPNNLPYPIILKNIRFKWRFFQFLLYLVNFEYRYCSIYGLWEVDVRIFGVLLIQIF